MEPRIRTTRTLKVTEVIVTPEEREQLAQLYPDPRYKALLDVMERACIEIETAHLNTPMGNPEEILGGHCMSKGVWLFFQYIQKQVAVAFNINEAENSGEEGENPPPATLNDVLQGVS